MTGTGKLFHGNPRGSKGAAERGKSFPRCNTTGTAGNAGDLGSWNVATGSSGGEQGRTRAWNDVKC
jgi:hypothetical protein